MKSRHFELFVLSLFGIGLIATAVAFLVGLLTRPATHLAEAGDFVSGVTAIFGIMLGTFAILVYVRAEDVRTKAAGQAWAAKLRLEDALHMFVVLLKAEITHSGVDSVSSKSVLFGHGLHVLQEALKDARVAGLYRVLATPRAQQDDFNVAYEFACLEAHVRHDLSTQREGVGQALIDVPPRLYDGLRDFHEDDIRTVLGGELPQGPIDSIKAVASRETSADEEGGA